MPPNGTAFSQSELENLFNQVDGYCNLGNTDLYNQLIAWELLEGSNRTKPQVVASYVKWSFTASFLMMVNAWQWFLSGILLARQGFMLPQVSQLHYYSILFSYESFLAAQLRGYYTVEERLPPTANIGSLRQTRRLVWIDTAAGVPRSIVVECKGRGGFHDLLAKWFYDVFVLWDPAIKHPEVHGFAGPDYRTHLVSERNDYTYSLASMAEDLAHMPTQTSAPTSAEQLAALWQHSHDEIDAYPECYWCLEHLKVATNMHMRLRDNFHKGYPYTDAQCRLVHDLCSHHKQNGLLEFVTVALGWFLQDCPTAG